jgi:hypothetical protein
MDWRRLTIENSARVHPRRYGIAVCLALFCGIGQGLRAQSPTPPKRPFDMFPGILVSCQSEGNVKWMDDACTYLLAEVKRRGGESKIAVSVQPSSSGMATKKFGEIDGFNGDKAIRMAWTLKESSEVKGRVNVTLSSNFIWEPTAKEIPGIVPGQRLIQNFYLQGVLFDPDIRYSEVEASLQKLVNWFFDYGEGKK